MRPRLDLASAYAAAAARILSWLLISALVFRHAGPGPFALLALVRATLGILNYTTLGLAPAMVHYLPQSAARRSNSTDALLDENNLYSNGVALAWAAALVASLILFLYEIWFTHHHAPIPGVPQFIIPNFLTTMGLGTILRLASDPPGAALQINGQITIDNLILTTAELLWLIIAFAIGATLPHVGLAFLLSSAAILLARTAFAHRITGILVPRWTTLQLQILKKLLNFGLLVSLAQVADFLYAPTDYILIDRLLTPLDLAAYAPAIQIDAGLFVLVGALASVLLPKAAIAHARNDRTKLRFYYFQGTLISAALLLVGAATILAIAPRLFQAWLGNPMPATQSILPLVLISTVIGGSSAVGRSILLGAGKVKLFTLSVLMAGAANVIVSYALVKFAHAGLKGIVAGTLVAVIARCGIWMPWYVTRTLTHSGNTPDNFPPNTIPSPPFSAAGR